MDNPRKAAEERHDDIKNIGFDYKNQILRKSLSGFIYENPRNASILDKIEILIYDLIENVKRIKTTINFYVDKDCKKIN